MWTVWNQRNACIFVKINPNGEDAQDLMKSRVAFWVRPMSGVESLFFWCLGLRVSFNLWFWGWVVFSWWCFFICWSAWVFLQFVFGFLADCLRVCVWVISGLFCVIGGLSCVLGVLCDGMWVDCVSKCYFESRVFVS